MNMASFDLKCPAFWRNYVSTVEAEAGEALGLKNRDERVFSERSNKGIISSNQRPTYAFVFQERQTTFWDLFTKPVSNNKVINNYHSYGAPAAGRMTETEKEAEKKKKQADTAKIVGSFISIAGAFLMGFAYKKWEAQSETTKRTQAVKDSLDFHLEKNDLPKELKDESGNLLKLVGYQLRIDTLKNQKITGYFLATIGLFVGGVVWAGGGFAVIPAVMTMGKVTLVASAVIAAGNCGIHWGDGKEITQLRKQIVGDPDKHSFGLADQILFRIWQPSTTREESPSALKEPNTAEGIPVVQVPGTNQYVPLYPYGKGEHQRV